MEQELVISKVVTASRVKREQEKCKAVRISFGWALLFLLAQTAILGAYTRPEAMSKRVETISINSAGTKADSMRKKALIIGVTGQDGAYLAEFLLSKGYEVHGVKRRSSLINTERLDGIYQDPHVRADKRFMLHYGDSTDGFSILNLIQQIQPDEVYNLAAQSHVKVSFELPAYTAQVDALGTLHVLEAIRISGLSKKTRF